MRKILETCTTGKQDTEMHGGRPVESAIRSVAAIRWSIAPVDSSTRRDAMLTMHLLDGFSQGVYDKTHVRSVLRAGARNHSGSIPINNSPENRARCVFKHSDGESLRAGT